MFLVVTNQPSPSAVRFGPADVGQLGAQAQQLAVPQVAVIGLRAVGRHDRGEPGLVQDRHHLPERIGAAVGGRRLQPWHGPDLHHRRRCDQLAVHRAAANSASV